MTRMGYSPVMGPFKSLQSDQVWSAYLQGFSDLTKKGWSHFQVTGHFQVTAGTEISMSITQYTGGHDSFWIPWHMVLVTDSKPNGVLF